MWLFGIISLVEMQMLRIIREFYPDGLWKIYLNKGRISKAENVFQNRKIKNEHIDLVECLQLCDKKVIFIKDKNIINYLGEFSSEKIETLLISTEEIRNNIAHSQDFLAGFWPDLFYTIIDLIKFLEHCEKIKKKE